MGRAELLSAFQSRFEVCLNCQSVWHDEGGANCPDCGQPWEQFADDDLIEAATLEDTP